MSLSGGLVSQEKKGANSHDLKSNAEARFMKDSEKVDIKEIEKDIKEISNKIIVGNYADSPNYLKDNEYIKRGYLINCHSVRLVLRSLFVCSNETINIWSHLIGCIISISLIILTAIFIKRGKIKELSLEEYETLKIQINETIIPWSSELSYYKIIEEEEIDSKVCPILDNILSKTENLVSEYSTYLTIAEIIQNYIYNVDDLINNIIKSFSNIKNTKIYAVLTTKWRECSNKIMSFIKYDNEVTGENIKRWPLFVMLSASIVCLGFSTAFHWFSIYNEKVYILLTRLDYAGITFLIPGSCYPPYFYFYYCEKCKIYFY